MKLMFIHSQAKNLVFELESKDIRKLPKKLLLLYSIQYKELASSIKKQLENKKIKILGFQQVLGCSRINTQSPILLIGTGDFHLLNILKQAQDVYFFNGILSKIDKKQIQKLRAKRQASLLKFLSAKKIGILVSTKPGQENLAKAIKLKQQLIKKKKQVFLFISNKIDTNEFENFDIDVWINTACAGLSYDNPKIINVDEISNFKK